MSHDSDRGESNDSPDLLTSTGRVRSLAKNRPGSYTFGRPSLYESEYATMLVDHMAEGLSFESFGGRISVSRATLYTWLDLHPDFLDAKSIGESKSREWWERKGQEGLFAETIREKGPDGTTTTVTRSINASIWVFSMKNRFKWRDKQPDEESEDISKDERYPSMTKAQAKKLLEEQG